MLTLPDEHEGRCECCDYLMNTRVLVNVIITWWTRGLLWMLRLP